MSGRTALWAALLLPLSAACKPNVVARGDLDRLEAVLSPAPAQRPAWEAFRREAEASNGSWNRDFRRIMGAERFDAAAARAAADAAHADARRVITAWEKVDALLTPAQRAALRETGPL